MQNPDEKDAKPKESTFTRGVERAEHEKREKRRYLAIKLMQLVLWAVALGILLLVMYQGGIGYREQLLFRANIEFDVPLNEGKIPSELQKLFAKNGQALSSDATVDMVEEYVEWQIIDLHRKREYLVVAGEKNLEIYQGVFLVYFGDADKNTSSHHFEVAKEYFARKSLFSINIRYRQDWPQKLNKGLPKKLRQLFCENNCRVSDNATVEIKESGSEWLIGKQKFIVARKENSLNVYREKKRFRLYRFALFTAWKNAKKNGDNPKEQGEGEEEFRRFRNFSDNFWKKAGISVRLIFPALVVTVLMAALLGLFDWGFSIALRRLDNRFVKSKSTFLSKKLLLAGRSIAYWLPSIFSAIPPFVTGIFVIQLSGSHLIDQYNFFYGTLCLAAFNVNYFYRRAQQKIKDAYRAADVLFARSLGLDERIVFRCHILPRVIRDNLIILRELLPHVVVESIVIEYVFAYGGLLRSALDIITHYRADEQETWDRILGNWEACAYIVMALWLSVLFVAIFAYVCRCLEDYFSPQ